MLRLPGKVDQHLPQWYPSVRDLEHKFFPGPGHITHDDLLPDRCGKCNFSCWVGSGCFRSSYFVNLVFNAIPFIPSLLRPSWGGPWGPCCPGQQLGFRSWGSRGAHITGAPTCTHPETGRCREGDDRGPDLSLPKGKGQQEETLLPKTSFLRKLALSGTPFHLGMSSHRRAAWAHSNSPCTCWFPGRGTRVPPSVSSCPWAKPVSLLPCAFPQKRGSASLPF